MSKDTNRPLGHGDDNDGIDEYDNPLPDWWRGLFYITIVGGAIYAVEYHGTGRSQAAAWEAEVAEAAQRWPAPAPGAELDLSEAAVRAGEVVYQQNCIPCHGAALKGGIGPDLTDATWIHGGTPGDIRRVVDAGVPAKGMVQWGPVLGAERVSQVAAFVYVHSQAK